MYKGGWPKSRQCQVSLDRWDASQCLALLRTSERALLGGVHLSTCSLRLLVTTGTRKYQVWFNHLSKSFAQWLWDANPPKAATNSNCDPGLENQIKNKQESALDCKKLVIQASSCKSCNVQHLIYPFTISWHLLRVGKTLWQCKCLLAFNRFSVLVCKRYQSKEWMTTLQPRWP